MSGKLVKPITLASLVTAFALAAALAVPVGVACAADDNLVNPQQLPDSSFIYDSTIAELAVADSYFDNQTVQVVGEAVGDNITASFSGNRRWVTLVDSDDLAIDVFMSADAAARIDSFGEYGVTGTTLQVRGTFHLACSEHEGLSDLHADSVTVMKAGQRHPDEFNLQAFAPGAVLLAVGLGLVVALSYLRERQR